MSTLGKPNEEPKASLQWSVLVGAPDQILRQRLASALRLQGHSVVEASDVDDMRARLVEFDGIPFDLILCGGVFTQVEDPELAQKLASKKVTRALVLIPSGGLLSTATRAERLAANAVMQEPPNFDTLSEVLKSAILQDHGGASNFAGMALTHSS